MKFSSDGDGADSMHSTAFDLEWECEGTPDLSDSFGTCEVTDSVFGTVGWKIKDKKRYFAKVSSRCNLNDGITSKLLRNNHNLTTI